MKRDRICVRPLTKVGHPSAASHNCNRPPSKILNGLDLSDGIVSGMAASLSSLRVTRNGLLKMSLPQTAGQDASSILVSVSVSFRHQ